MRRLQFATAIGIAMLALGCSKPVGGSSTPIVGTPHIEVVRLPGTPPPVLIRVAQTGVAREGCANNDGPAVEFVFKVESELPTVSIKDPSATNLTLMFGLPQLGNQELHVRVNAPLARVKNLKQWTIGNPDTEDGLLAWVCPVESYPCDFATVGTVAFTRATDEFIEGQANLIFQSKNTLVGRLSAKLAPRAKQSNQSFFCG